jgi:hypothetical protein
VPIDATTLLAHAHRPAAQLTRRDVARLMVSVPSMDALAAMPTLRRELLAARNPFSAKFWESAEAVLKRIAAGAATVGEVHGWLEATGTEPTAIIGLHVWEEEPSRTQLAHEMHDLLVTHLEEHLAAGDIDPDQLLTDNPAALKEYRALQERWLTSPLPDGRIPMNELLDEADEDLFAEWDAAEQAALDELQDILDEVGERPRPDAELETACRSLRIALQHGQWPADLLRTGGGVDPQNLDPDDQQGLPPPLRISPGSPRVPAMMETTSTCWPDGSARSWNSGDSSAPSTIASVSPGWAGGASLRLSSRRGPPMPIVPIQRAQRGYGGWNSAAEPADAAASVAPAVCGYHVVQWPVGGPGCV